MVFFVFAALAAASPAPTVSSAVRFHFVAKPIAGLARNLDCMSGVIACNREAYRDHWKKDLALSLNDEVLLEAWGAAHEEDERVTWDYPPFEEETTFPLPVQAPDLAQRVRLAALQADSLDDYRSRLELLLRPHEVQARVALVQKFLPRYEKYFATQKVDLDRYTKAATELIAKKKLDELTTRIARFYGTELPLGYTVHFALVPRPVSGSRKTFAEQLDNHAVIEVPTGEAPEERIDVMMHELFHFFYVSAPQKSHAKMIAALAQNSDPSAFNGYALLSESLAAAFAHGVVASRVLEPLAFRKTLEKKNGLHGDDVIDAIGKALLPMLEASLENGDVLDERFMVRVYLDAFERALGVKGHALATGLRNFALGYDRTSLRYLRNAVRDSTHAVAMSSFSPLDNAQTAWELYRFVDQNAVVLVVGKEIDKLGTFEPMFGKEIIARLQKLATTQTAFAYGIARSKKAKTYVLFGKDGAAVQEFLPKLLASQGAFDGPVLP
jgi:hypothetical protein